MTKPILNNYALTSNVSNAFQTYVTTSRGYRSSVARNINVVMKSGSESHDMSDVRLASDIL